MHTKQIVVRIVKPASKPTIPEIKSVKSIKKGKAFLSKTLNILAGSGIGLGVGAAIYLMLKLSGLNFGSLESSFIIGLPSALGIITSYVIF